MGKVAIFLSDLHLNRGDELEGFPRENETAFGRFLSRQSENYQSQEVDLVLLGDFLDIWHVATDKEKKAETSREIDIGIKEVSEGERVKQIVSVHTDTFAALKKFLVADRNQRRVICTVGNYGPFSC